MAVSVTTTLDHDDLKLLHVAKPHLGKTGPMLSDGDALRELLRRFPRQQVIDLALVILDKRLRHPGVALSCPEDVTKYLRLKTVENKREVLGALFLDNQHRLIADEQLFLGTIDSATIYPREVVRIALQHNAAALMLYHNHPSGLADPSTADRRMTEHIEAACDLVAIRLLDHLVVGRDEVTSMASRGWLKEPPRRYSRSR